MVIGGLPDGLGTAANGYLDAFPAGEVVGVPITGVERVGIPVWVVALFPDTSDLAGIMPYGIGYGTTDEAAILGALGEIAEMVWPMPPLSARTRTHGSYADLAAGLGARAVADPLTLLPARRLAGRPPHPARLGGGTALGGRIGRAGARAGSRRRAADRRRELRRRGSRTAGNAARSLHDRAGCGVYQPLHAGTAGRWRAEPARCASSRLGRVDRRKGVLDFLHALAMTSGAWTATVSGVGPDVDAAQALAIDVSLGNRVAFSAYADYEAVPALYRAHDVFVSPTCAEGFSNTILKAMASGQAILSCRSVDMVDCIRDGENGLLTEAGDVPAVAAALGRLVAEVVRFVCTGSRLG